MDMISASQREDPLFLVSLLAYSLLCFYLHDYS